MDWGFDIGQLYNRRRDIHSRFRGQEQGGMITPRDFALVVLITGEEGQQHWYRDYEGTDGAFYYFGHGQIGDMQLHNQNRRLAESNIDGRDVLLFRKTRDGLLFLGEMVYDSHQVVRERDRLGDERDAIVFKLWPAEKLEQRAVKQPAPTTAAQTDLNRLRQVAYAAAGPAVTSTTLRTIYDRSSDVRRYVLARSKGSCEGCMSPAPFVRTDGAPYLEPHHVNRVADGGPDSPAFVIALCPNCHRRVHAGADGPGYNRALTSRISDIERALGPVRLAN